MEKIYEFNGEFQFFHFKKRINRFTVETEENELCHLHDPGRLSELLIPGNIMMAIIKNRGLKCEIISVKSNNEEILINSRFHSNIAENLINGGYLNKNFKIIKKEIIYDNSRLDFLLENIGKKYFLEVKGCTLLKGKFAKFPDAPTIRGTKHVRELIKIKNSGFGAGILFLIFRNAEYFSPNYEMDKNFYYALLDSFKNGVDIFTIRLFLNGSHLYYDGIVKLKFDGPAGI
ncbi:MAG: DNA/RNA nuclease SfsA [Thermoplasmata archaeon]